jgi:hypothetical protein
MSLTNVAQMALSHIGSGRSITDIDTDISEEARALRTFQDVAIKTAMRAAPWSFCTEILALGLVEEDPNDEWDYSYRYPSTAVGIRRILSGARTDTSDTRSPYKIARDSSGKLIFSDEEDAEAEITVYVSDVSQWPEDFKLAVSYLWAALVCPRVTKEDPMKIKRDLLGLYNMSVLEAKVNNHNEEQPDQEPDSEFIRCRE